MVEFDTQGASAQGYLAAPDSGTGPGVVVLHEWWGLTEPIRLACDRLAEAGFVALAPDLYHGKTTASVEEAEKLGGALDEKVEQWRGDIRGAVEFLRQHGREAASGDKFAFVGLSLGGSYALDMSVNMAEDIAAAIIFYTAWAGPEYRHARAAYLFHFAEHDQFEPAESVAELERTLREAGRSATFYTYPGTTHWFTDTNIPDTYNAEAAALAWERTIAFLNAQLRNQPAGQ